MRRDREAGKDAAVVPTAASSQRLRNPGRLRPLRQLRSVFSPCWRYLERRGPTTVLTHRKTIRRVEPRPPTSARSDQLQPGQIAAALFHVSRLDDMRHTLRESPSPPSRAAHGSYAGRRRRPFFRSAQIEMPEPASTPPAAIRAVVVVDVQITASLTTHPRSGGTYSLKDLHLMQARAQPRGRCSAACGWLSVRSALA